MLAAGDGRHGTWGRRATGVALAVTAVALTATPAAAREPIDAATLFTHSAAGGELRGERLALHGVSRRVTYVTAGGESGTLRVKRMHRLLFENTTPTATLHIAGHRGGDELTLKLSGPRHRPERRTVSYRVERLDDHGLPARSIAANRTREFGRASLSIVSTPRALTGPFGNICWTTFTNLTGYGMQAVSFDLIGGYNQRWEQAGTVGQQLALGQYSSWKSDGNNGDGCSNHSVWTLIRDPYDPRGPAPPAGVTFEMTNSLTPDGTPSYECTSSSTGFTCQFQPANPQLPGEAYWQICAVPGEPPWCTAGGSKASRGTER
jgi:hypothetical protein